MAIVIIVTVAYDCVDDGVSSHNEVNDDDDVIVNIRVYVHALLYVI